MLATQPAPSTTETNSRRPEQPVRQSRLSQRARSFNHTPLPTHQRQATSPESFNRAITESDPLSFFKVSSQGVTGEFDEQTNVIVSSKLRSMREGSEAIGVELEMDTVGYVAMYDGDSTIAYRYDPESDPKSPHLVGALVNQRVPMSALLKRLINLSI